jgi:hypothetical protein
MRRLAQQFELGGQYRDTHIRLGACEVGLKCVSLVSSFRQSLKRCSLLGSHWLGRVQFQQSKVAASDEVKSCTLMKRPKTIKHRADNDSARECPDKCAQLFVSEYDAHNAAKPSSS